MLRILSAAAGLLAVAATASSAADMRMPVKAPPPVVAPVATWTGFYIGVNGGYSWGRARNDNLTVAVPGVVGVGVAGSESLNLTGGVAGGQIGYNWQVSNWVWGLEGDGQWSDERGSATFVCGAACTGTAAAAVAVTFRQKIDAFGTFRGRVGWLATPDVLFYGTGGLAVGSIKTSLAATAAAAGLATGIGASSSTTRAGWTVGAGIEGMFAPHWSAKLEYLFMDYGRIGNALTFAGLVTIGASTRVTDNIIRAGVNYHF
jgi:outer membrane immunogenic protein